MNTTTGGMPTLRGHMSKTAAQSTLFSCACMPVLQTIDKRSNRYDTSP